MPKVSFNDERCKGCGLCISVCPKKILAPSEIINSKGYRQVAYMDESKCIGCAFCARMCPDCVIKVER